LYNANGRSSDLLPFSSLPIFNRQWHVALKVNGDYSSGYCTGFKPVSLLADPGKGFAHQCDANIDKKEFDVKGVYKKLIKKERRLKVERSYFYPLYLSTYSTIQSTIFIHHYYSIIKRN